MNIFIHENFPIYGIMSYTTTLLATIIQNQVAAAAVAASAAAANSHRAMCIENLDC